MSNEVISVNVQAIMAKIGKAIEKAVGEDIRTYLSTNDNATNNALPFLRGDYINTNIKKAMESEAVEIKYFNRSSWKGVILIVRDDQVTLSVCAKKTLDRIPKNRNRKSPHYLQSILYTENGDEHSSSHQMTLYDLDDSFVCGFTNEELEKDFLAIMEETLSLHDNFRHWVITYEAERSSVVELTAVLLDKDFGRVKEISLLNLLKPNFGDLTSTETNNQKQKDVHSLVSIKPGMVGHKASEPEKRTEILPKSVEESKKA